MIAILINVEDWSQAETIAEVLENAECEGEIDFAFNVQTQETSSVWGESI